VPDDLSEHYRDFLKNPATGLAKLIPRGKYDFVAESREYYSFSRRTYVYGSASEIQLSAQQGFSTGFAGADYGFFAIVGRVPIENVPVDVDSLPLGANIQPDLWKLMWTYHPPTDLEALRAERQAHLQNTQVIEGQTYLLRSIHPRLSDILVAFHVERVLNDGSVVIVWRLLKAFQPPLLPAGSEGIRGPTRAPEVVKRFDPTYTEEARAKKLEGPVRLSITVGTDGKAHNVQVVRSLEAGLDQKAIECIQEWVFNPAIKDGTPVSQNAQIELNFRLK
jgi:TonB family protein